MPNVQWEDKLSVFLNVCICQSCMHLQCMFSLMTAIFSGPGQFTITSVSVGAGRDLINVTFVQVSHVMTMGYCLLQQ